MNLEKARMVAWLVNDVAGAVSAVVDAAQEVKRAIKGKKKKKKEEDDSTDGGDK